MLNDRCIHEFPVITLVHDIDAFVSKRWRILITITWLFPLYLEF